MPSKIKYLKVNGVTYELGESGGGGGSGTVTGIRMNGTIKGTSGIVDLGTVLTEHQSLAGYAKKTDIPTNLSDLADDDEHRTVTDDEKSKWNSKANGISTLVPRPEEDTVYLNLTNDNKVISMVPLVIPKKPIVLFHICIVNQNNTK